MRVKPLEIEALERALQAIGPDKLSARLNSRSELIQTWINGHASMPQRKFLALLLRADQAIE